MEDIEKKYEDYILYVEHLSTVYTLKGKKIRAMTDVTFGLKEGESVGIVGESGCGKSTLAMAISHIHSQNSVVTSGRIYFRGQVIVDTEMGVHFTLRETRKSRKVENELKTVRWNGISIVFQGALDSLNPLFRIGEQLSDILIHKMGMNKEDAAKNAGELLESVGLDKWVMTAFPHQLSGGMKQRVVIAMAIILKPSLVIADEPTTSLDVITQYRIIEEINKLRLNNRIAVINISHDISLISRLSDRIMVMYAGRVIEKIPSNQIDQAQHPYTYMLVDSIPKLDKEISLISPIRGAPPGLSNEIIGCPFYDRCDYSIEACLDPQAPVLKDIGGNHEVGCVVLPKKNRTSQVSSVPFSIHTGTGENIVSVKGLTKIFQKKSGIREISSAKGGEIVALDNLDLTINRGESVALVGETGSGKTTLGRILGLLDSPTSGEVVFEGEPLTINPDKEVQENVQSTSNGGEKTVKYDKTKIAKIRRRIQTIFQDPFQSINPRFSVYKAMREPLQINKIHSSKVDQMHAITGALESAELTPVEEFIGKYPHELSGGQRQRVVIARALVLEPEVLIADEPISMLDVSLRAGVLNFLNNIRSTKNVSLFYITHDIASARYISNRIYVLYKGTMMESGNTEEIVRNAAHPYTIALIISSIGLAGNATATLGENIFESGEDVITSACKFAPRCPLATDKCFKEEVPNVNLGNGHMVKCHYGRGVYDYLHKQGITSDFSMATLRSAVL